MIEIPIWLAVVGAVALGSWLVAAIGLAVVIYEDFRR